MSSRPQPNERRRSKLIAMADNRAQLEAAAQAGADIVQISVEDGVAPERRSAACRSLAAALLDIDWGTCERWVKINPFGPGSTPDDIEVLAEGRPEAFILAKGRGVDDVRAMAELIDAAEQAHGLPEGSVRMCASIERITALHTVEEVAAADRRLVSLQFSPYDLGRQYGYRLDMTGPSWETLYAKSRCVLAARLAGIEIGDAPYFFSLDLEGTLRSTLWSIQLGFTHKACHSPAQVPLIHRAFDAIPGQDLWADAYLAAEHGG